VRAIVIFWSIWHAVDMHNVILYSHER